MTAETSDGIVRVDKVVRSETARQGRHLTEVAEKAGLDRAITRRLARGEASISDASLFRLEGSLGMPRGLLAAVRDGDVEVLRDMGSSDPDLIRYALKVAQRTPGRPPGGEDRRRGNDRRKSS